MHAVDCGVCLEPSPGRRTVLVVCADRKATAYCGLACQPRITDAGARREMPARIGPPVQVAPPVLLGRYHGGARRRGASTTRSRAMAAAGPLPAGRSNGQCGKRPLPCKCQWPPQLGPASAAAAGRSRARWPSWREQTYSGSLTRAGPSRSSHPTCTGLRTEQRAPHSEPESL